MFIRKLVPLALLLACGGCERFQTREAKAEEPAHTEAPTEPAARATPGSAEGHGHGAEPAPAGGAALKYDVPFAWEVSKTEPLAKTRAFLAETLADNESYRQKGDKYFHAFAKAQTPRATVVSCADSRVHSHAWDLTPDNDDFIIRNIGNQPKPAAGAAEERAWADAVVANVNQQVAFAVQHFGSANPCRWHNREATMRTSSACSRRCARRLGSKVRSRSRSTDVRLAPDSFDAEGMSRKRAANLRSD